MQGREEAGSNFSNTKRTLIMLLNQEIEQLQKGVIEMKEDSLIKNVAKRKVLYNISQAGLLELVYSYLALAEYYIQNGLLDSGLKSLMDSRELQIIGDSSYLLGQVYFKRGGKEEALRFLENCLNEEWIEPSVEHQIASKLEAMTSLQQLYFATGQREKLIQLSYNKIKLTQQIGGKFSDNYFHALSLIDMSIIHEAFTQYPMALEKLETALTLLESSSEEPAKQIEVLELRGALLGKMGKRKGEEQSYQRALDLLRRYPTCVSEDKQAKMLQSLIECRIYA